MTEKITKPSLDDELAELDGQLALLEAKREAEEKQHRLDVGKLRLKFTQELGKEGRDFAIVDTVEGVVVVKRVSAMVAKVFRDSISGDKENTPAKSFAYTAPGVVVPDRDTYKKWCEEADFIPVIVANALTGLHGLVDGEKRAKR